MAVAEKTKSSEKQAKETSSQLVSSSIIEGAIIFAALALMCSIIPTYWFQYVSGLFRTDYLATSLLLLVVVLVGVGAVGLVAMFEGPKPEKGIRAGGIFMGLGMVIAVNVFLALISVLGGQFSVIVGVIGSAAIGVGIVALFYVALIQPRVQSFLMGLEGNGLFHARGFKYNQGMKVRRATLIALLGVIGFGISWAIRNKFFADGDWYYNLFTSGASDARITTYVVVLYKTLYTLPAIITVILGWFAWRIINYPMFTDFLIATEAEMNKVSWTTRKRLFQDTIVVLVTVCLFTVFLFLMDIMWVQILKFPVPGVLQVDPEEIKAEQMAPKEW